jgi:hypothetical protein
MKRFLNLARLDGWKPRMGNLCIVLALVIGAGCRKSPSAPSAVAPPAAPDAASTAGPAITPPQARIGSASTLITNAPTQLQLLNRAMLGWEMQNHRRPRTFEEFASTAGFQIADPPAGKKYALDQNGYIVLVNSN